jgi:hypothetical protein
MSETTKKPVPGNISYHQNWKVFYSGKQPLQLFSAHTIHQEGNMAFRITLGIVLCAFLFGCSGTKKAGDITLDKYRGNPTVRGKVTGFFHTENIKGKWFLITPGGNGFFGMGMQLSFRGGDTTASTAVLKSLAEWGFNSLSGFVPRDSASKWPYYILMSSTGGRRGGKSTFGDVFSKEFETQADERIDRVTKERKADPWLIGYFTDNELFWTDAWGGGKLDGYLSLHATDSGCVKALSFVKSRYASINDFNTAWRTKYASFEALAADTAVSPKAGYDKQKVYDDRIGFLRLVSERYHGYLYKKFKELDPNHLVMGNRFLTGDIPDAVLEGMRGNTDAVSANCYALHTMPHGFFNRAAELANAPIMITEFGYSAFESDIPMDRSGAIPRVVQSQEDRAHLYKWYMECAASSPVIIGTLWWWFQDGFHSGAGGPHSPNRGNFGFFDRQYKPYQAISQSATEVHHSLINYRLASVAPCKGADPAQYRIKRTTPLKLDADTAKYGALDITIDPTCCKYEGYGFAGSGLSARASMRRDSTWLYAIISVSDTSVVNKIVPVADTTMKFNVWEIDGVELRFGGYEMKIYFDGKKAVVNLANADPFPGIEAVGKIVKGGYIIEARIPMSEINWIIKDNAIRFTLGVDDGTGFARYRQLQYPPSFEWIYKETYGIGEIEP